MPNAHSKCDLSWISVHTPSCLCFLDLSTSSVYIYLTMSYHTNKDFYAAEGAFLIIINMCQNNTMSDMV